MTDTTLSIVAAGDVSERVLETAAAAVETTFDLTPVISPTSVPESELDGAYDRDRDRYEAIEVVDAIEEWVAADRWLVVTPVDITQGRNNYVFGLAVLSGDRAILSTHRLEDEDDAVFSDRVRKEAIKQVGRLLGAEECDNEQCVFRATPTAHDLDSSGDEPCQACRAQVAGIGHDTTGPDRDRELGGTDTRPVPDVSTVDVDLDDGTATDSEAQRSTSYLGNLAHETASIGRFWGSVLGFGISVVIGYFLLSTVGELLFGTVELTEPLLFVLGLVNLVFAWVIFRQLRTISGWLLQYRRSFLAVPLFVVMMVWLLSRRLLAVPIRILDRVGR